MLGKNVISYGTISYIEKPLTLILMVHYIPLYSNPFKEAKCFPRSRNFIGKILQYLMTQFTFQEFTKCQGVMPYSYKYIGRGPQKGFSCFKVQLQFHLVGLTADFYLTSSHQAKIHNGLRFT